eukprot:Gregarina_sp_Poly_1__2613@NODE_170_length_12067_cov_151_813333_g151_i0_p3_GENE_NODE_170_length_12067_cov_151_813333_g151_i0NODE_170_length_12067_cov_151_813333_g151_i0_p3_ORF_typecomplete_len564_score62_37TPP_enzyme_N/PF02776_18/2_2e43TPP_enzyme_C/PF02775_21/6_2e29TPP_enzyme_M/PF00205_22/5_2e18Transketolase_N/PF00456_21/3_8e03Transketolase_N/PF00456_21/0_5_NODE_170_length_12067_cov_151_813333_g151_i042155906
MKLGEFLCECLHDAGVKDLFGVPGDFSLGLLNSIVESKIRYIGTCNELNAAYAADGYARVRGLGVCVTTYSVGELSALNGVAGSWAESVPVVCIVGCPARRFYADMPLLHHTLGDYEIPFKMFKMITCAQTMLRDPATAASEINHVIAQCLLKMKPVYIGIPADMVGMEIPVPSAPWTAPKLPVSDPDILAEAVEEITERIAKSSQPVFIPGVELIRRRLVPSMVKLLNKSQIPYVTMLLSKSLIDENNDLFIGLYSGDRSRAEVKHYVDTSDCIVLLGEKLTDFNTGGFTAVFNPKTRIYVGYDFVQVSGHSYHGIYIHDLILALIDKIKTFEAGEIEYPRARTGCIHRRSSPAIREEENQELTMHKFFRTMANFLPNDCVVMAETGSSLFSAAETMMPPNTLFIGQTFYGSIGYTVGGCLGACIGAEGTGRRVFLFIGDGSFQVTAQDLSTMIRYNCNPVIFLINNDGYTIERVITDNIYNNIQPWKYSDLPKVFGGKPGLVCRTRKDLENALTVSQEAPGELHFIEIMLDKWDCNDLLKNAGKVMARNNNLSPVVSANKS